LDLLKSTPSAITSTKSAFVMIYFLYLGVIYREANCLKLAKLDLHVYPSKDMKKICKYF
jgi:hypothetical protein